MSILDTTRRPRRPAGLLVVLLALAGLLALAARPTPPPAVLTAGTAGAVASVSAVCPQVSGAGTPRRSRVSAAAVPRGGDTGDPAGAGFDVQPLGAGSPAQPQVGLATGLQQLADGGLVATARGPAAAGLEVEQVDRADGPTERGLADLRCPAPATELWFAGGATTLGARLELLLANPGDAPAVVDVRLWSATGPTDDRPGGHQVVPARGRLGIDLARLAPNRDLVAVHVSAVRGQVAGAVRYVRINGRLPRGVSWVPPAGAPATQVVLAGMPAEATRRTVQITNPGDTTATAGVRLATSDGEADPAGLQQVRVPPATSVQLDLGVSAAAVTASVRADQPVLAVGVAEVAGPAGLADLALAGATEPLASAAVVVDLGRPGESTLLVAAPSGDATVQLVAGGQERTTRVSAGQTVSLSVDGPGPVLLRPVTGQVHAARLIREADPRGPLLTLLALEGGAPAVARPAVVADPALGS